MIPTGRIRQLRDTIRPAFALDFMSGAFSLDPAGSITRALDTASRIAPTGSFEGVNADLPRWDYSPTTLALRGLLLEDTRTNGVRNSTGSGAVAGTPGTLPTNWQTAQQASMTFNVVGSGVEDGIAYVDIQYVGTASSGSTSSLQFTANTEIAALTDQTWTLSAYIKRVAGSLTGVNRFNLGWEERSGVFVRNNTSAALTLPTTGRLSAARHAYTAANSGGATVAYVKPFIRFVPISGGVIDVTLRIGLPQMELGDCVTSVISTTSAAVTRNADSLVLTDIAQWFNPVEGTLYAEYENVAAGASTIIAFDDGTANEMIRLRTDGTNPFFTVTDGGSDVANIDAGTVAANTVYRFAAAYRANDFSACINGGAVQTDTSGALPTVDRMRIGSDQAGNFLNGRLRRLMYFPQRLAPAELRALTV